MRIYLDANVFISAVRDEIDGAFNMRGRDADTFFSICADRKYLIVLSELFFDEVKNTIYLEKESTIETLHKYKVIFEELYDVAEKEKVKEIISKTGIHYSDAVHTRLAIKSNCDLIISWNKRDFSKIKELIEFKTPEEFNENLT